jgi:hypothetical protein
LILKLSVLASGAVWLDGQPIEMDALDQKLHAADKETTAVWYYREAAGKDATPHAMAVIQLVIKHKLRISISSQPDFSDYVNAKGVSHPRAPQAVAHMPEVVVASNIGEIFENIRKIATGDKGQGGLVILRPDRSYLVVPPMPESPELKKFAEGLSHLMPAGVQRNVAVIANTEFGGGSQAPSVAEVNQAIPFFGLLMGLSYLGHALWVFEGHASAFQAGCWSADALVVDSAMLALLQAGWQETARAALRNANILVHDRATFQLRVVSNAGATTAGLGFAAQPFRA